MASLTINIGSELVEQAQARAKAEGKSFDQLIEAALADLVGRGGEADGVGPAHGDVALDLDAFFDSFNRKEPGDAAERGDRKDLLDEIFEIADQSKVRPTGPWLTDEEMYDR